MLLRRIARPLFASWFIAQGVDAVRHPARHAATARKDLEEVRLGLRGRPGLEPVEQALDVPLTDKQLAAVVAAHGAAVATAAAFLALGKAPRTAGVALAVLVQPLVLASIPTSRVHDEADAARRRRFWMSVSALGGALLAGADTAGRPGVAYRIRAARESRAAARAE